MSPVDARLRRLQRAAQRLSAAEEKTSAARDELHAEIVAAYEEGASISEIARAIDGTRQWVQQVLRRGGRR